MFPSQKDFLNDLYQLRLEFSAIDRVRVARLTTSSRQEAPAFSAGIAFAKLVSGDVPSTTSELLEYRLLQALQQGGMLLRKMPDQLRSWKLPPLDPPEDLFMEYLRAFHEEAVDFFAQGLTAELGVLGVSQLVTSLLAQQHGLDSRDTYLDTLVIGNEVWRRGEMLSLSCRRQLLVAILHRAGEEGLPKEDLHGSIYGSDAKGELALGGLRDATNARLYSLKLEIMVDAKCWRLTSLG